jgi:hypothetical protein
MMAGMVDGWALLPLLLLVAARGLWGWAPRAAGLVLGAALGFAAGLYAFAG